MDHDQMSNEENYHLDVAGFLHVPSVLTPGEVNRLNKAIDTSNETSGFLGLPEGKREAFRDF